MAIRRWLESRWYSAQPAPLLLRPLGALYGSVAAARSARNLNQQRLQVPIIVVGNISVGGTGKTPFVVWLVEQLRVWGFKPGIVSRGYGGKAPQYPLAVTAQTDPAHCGDEPLLLAQRLGCPVMVDPNRLVAAQTLIEQKSVDVIVADDGLQHARLPRDLEICLVDGARGLGNGALLPAGPLREPASRLRSVDLVVVNGGAWRGEATQHVDMHLRLQEAVSLQTPQKTQALADWAGQKVHAVAGIGRPQRFFEQLETLGLQVIPHAFVDHHAYQPADLNFDDAAPVLMTEKDAVKCRAFADARCWAVSADAELSAADTVLVRKLIQAIER